MENTEPKQKVNMEKITDDTVIVVKKLRGRPKKNEEETLIEKPKIIYKKTKEQNKIYNQAYIERNKDRSYYCDICDITMTYFSSHNHPKTKRHILNEFIKEKKQQQPAYLKPSQNGCME
jgi:hypothetical protein